MGTLGYMAPEQLRDAHSADERTDIFSLGATLYAMLTGQPPFQGDDVLTIMNATKDAHYTPLGFTVERSLDPIFDEIVERCLAVDPADRY